MGFRSIKQNSEWNLIKEKNSESYILSSEKAFFGKRKKKHVGGGDERGEKSGEINKLKIEIEYMQFKIKIFI